MIMFWKKRENVETFSEHVKSLPEVRCGDKHTHYTYYYNGAKCSELEELDKEDRLARKIAEEVVKILKESEDVT